MISATKSDYLRLGLSTWLSHTRPRSGSTDLEEIGVAIGTDIGLVRNENQDRAVYASYRFCDPHREDFDLAILCDGIGGTANGGVAATTAVCEVLTYFAAKAASTFASRLTEAIQAANANVYERLGGRGGTTIALVLIAKGTVVASTVGDSRVYEFADQRAQQISSDDTVADEVLRLSGEKAVRSLPEFLSRSLAQYVGMGDGIEPRIHFFPSTSSKRILLTSDGAHRWPINLLNLLFSAAPSSHVFVSRIIALSKWAGGVDNASMLLVDPQRSSKSRTEFLELPMLSVWDSFSKCEFADPFRDDVRAKPIERDVFGHKVQQRPRRKPKAPSEATSFTHTVRRPVETEPETDQRVLKIELTGQDANDSSNADERPQT